MSRLQMASFTPYIPSQKEIAKAQIDEQRRKKQKRESLKEILESDDIEIEEERKDKKPKKRPIDAEQSDVEDGKEEVVDGDRLIQIVKAVNPRKCFHNKPTKCFKVGSASSAWFGVNVHVCSIEGFESCGFWEPDACKATSSVCRCGAPAKRGKSQKLNDDGTKTKDFGRWFHSCGLRKCKAFGWVHEPCWEEPIVE